MPTPQNPEPTMMPPVQPLVPATKSRTHIFGPNLLIFVVYYIATLGLLSSKANSGAFLLLALYVPHTLILIILSLIRFFKKQTRSAAMYAFTAIALGVIGFGACTFGIISSGALNGL